MSAIRKVPYIIRYNIFFSSSFTWVMIFVTLNYPDMSTVEVRGQHLLLKHTCADLRCLICSKYIPQLPNIWRFVSWHIYSVCFICDDDRDGGQDVIY